MLHKGLVSDSLTFLRRYLVPGLIFQSVVVGGGYGTGREIAEFFLMHGPLGGFFGMVLAALAWSVVLAVAFEFARVTKSYNYRSFFKALLGPAWPVFELLYFLIGLLVLSVLSAASGQMLEDLLGWPEFVGTGLLLTAVGALAYFGSKMIERALSYWSVLLYAVYTLFFVWVLWTLGDQIFATFTASELSGAWAVDGLRYAAYNLVALAAVLFVLPQLETRKEALGAGAIAGAVGIVPGIFVLIAMVAQYPEIVDQPVPVSLLLDNLGSLWLILLFQIVLFGTFVETGVGIIHAVNERVSDAFIDKGREYPQILRLALALGLLGLSMLLANAFGIIALIAQGYGYLSYFFVAIVVLPLLTLGLRRIAQHKVML